MKNPSGRDRGFTLVELMVVVLILGILVTIAVPVYTRSRVEAERKSCQANQRTISSAIEIMESLDAVQIVLAAGELEAGSDWYNVLIPSWIRRKPSCPVMSENYFLSAEGDIIGDRGSTQTFKLNHEAP